VLIRSILFINKQVIIAQGGSLKFLETTRSTERITIVWIAISTTAVIHVVAGPLLLPLHHLLLLLLLLLLPVVVVAVAVAVAVHVAQVMLTGHDDDDDDDMMMRVAALYTSFFSFCCACCRLPTIRVTYGYLCLLMPCCCYCD
jgi:hypothetical protein